MTGMDWRRAGWCDTAGASTDFFLPPLPPPEPEGEFARQLDLNARCKRGSGSLSLKMEDGEEGKATFCVIRGGQVVLCFTEPQEMQPNVSQGCFHGLGLQEGHGVDLALV